MVLAFNATEVLEMEGEDYTFAIDIEVIDKLEDQFDTSFDDLMKKIGSGKVRMGKMTKLFHGLLSREQPDLNLNEVAGLVFAHADEMMGAMERLFAKAWPEVAETKGAHPRKARRGTGASSSSNGARTASRQASSGSRPLEPSLSS